MRTLIVNTITSLILVLASAHSTAEWTDGGTIKGVYVDLRSGSERILFRHLPDNGVFVNPDGCRSDVNWYELRSDSIFSSNVYSALLSAEATKRKVRFYIEGCSATNWPLAVLFDGATKS